MLNWHAAPAEMAAEHVTQLLQVADRLPADVRDWLVQGLEAWQCGADLEQALGLEPVGLNQRDSMIRTVIELSPGNSVSARCSFFIGCLDGCETHPRHDMQQHVVRLRDENVPRSLKQLRRIVNGRRADGWREQGT
jgi:hypothetical protein